MMKNKKLISWISIAIISIVVISIFVATSSHWKETNYLKILNHTTTISIAIIGGVVTLWQLVTLAEESKKRNLNEKRRYATDMLREWNLNSADSVRLILEKFPDHLNSCTPIPIGEINSAISSNHEIKVAIRKLLNYFEYIAIAYNDCADQEIIKKSFGLSMIRYCLILQNYQLDHMKSTQRNHWLPFTQFVSNELTETIINCNLCRKSDCKLIKGEKFIHALALLNNTDLSYDEINEVDNLIE